MSDQPSPLAAGAARRARWLGELAQALDQANRLLFRLREVEKNGGEAGMIHALIVALRAEISALQRGAQRAGQGGNEVFNPKRMN